MTRIKFFALLFSCSALLHAQYGLSNAQALYSSQQEYFRRQREMEVFNKRHYDNIQSDNNRIISTALSAVTSLAKGSIPFPGGSLSVNGSNATLEINNVSITGDLSKAGAVSKIEITHSVDGILDLACIKIFENNITDQSISNARYDSSTNSFICRYNGRDYSLNFADYGISDSVVADFVRFLRLQKAAEPDNGRSIFVTANCSFVTHSIETVPLRLDAPNDLAKGLVDEDLILSSVSAGIDYDAKRTSRLNRPIHTRPMETIMGGIRSSDRHKKIVGDFDVFDILLDIISGVNGYGIALELTGASLKFEGNKIVPDLKYTFTPNRNGTTDYSTQGNPSPFGEMVKSVCNELNAYGVSEYFIKSNFPHAYKASLLMLLMRNVYENDTSFNRSVMRGFSDYSEYINKKRDSIPVDHNIFRDVIFDMRNTTAREIEESLITGIFPDDRLLSLYLLYSYYKEQNNTYNFLYNAVETRNKSENHTISNLTSELFRTIEHQLYKLVYVAPDHRIVDQNNKVDFYTLGPNLICILKNGYSSYNLGVTYPHAFGQINIYRNGIADWYDNCQSAMNDLTISQNESYKAFSKTEKYLKDDLIHDILCHEYAHGLDTFLYEKNSYFSYETEARAFLFEIANSLNPYYMIVHTKSNFAKKEDGEHAIGALMAISLMRSFAPKENFDTEYLLYEAEEIKKIALDAFMYTHQLYEVPLDESNGMPILPVYIENDGERMLVDSYKLKKPGMLFNTIVLPYIDQNREHAVGLCTLIEKDNIWDRELIDYFSLSLR
jgi:hypothetical protein